jgi:hypothetical protein
VSGKLATCTSELMRLTFRLDGRAGVLTLHASSTWRPFSIQDARSTWEPATAANLRRQRRTFADSGEPSPIAADSRRRDGLAQQYEARQLVQLVVSKLRKATTGRRTPTGAAKLDGANLPQGPAQITVHARLEQRLGLGARFGNLVGAVQDHVEGFEVRLR